MTHLWHRRHGRYASAGTALVATLALAAMFLAPAISPASAGGVGATTRAAALATTTTAKATTTTAKVTTTTAKTTTTTAVPGSNCVASVSGTAFGRTGWSATSNAPSSAADAPANALDGNSGTRFSTNEPQAAGLYLEVDLSWTHTFDALVLSSPNSAGDYARGYDVEVSGSGSTWATVAACSGTATPETVSFQTQAARYIRVVLTAGTASNWWSVDELNLYGGPQITSPPSVRMVPGKYNAFAIAATGSPAPEISESGSLPPGLGFRAGAGGTASISGTLPSDVSGTYDVALSAYNGVGGAVTEQLVITFTTTATTTALYSSANPSPLGEAVTYTAKVAPAPDGGTVEFLANGVAISGCAGVPVNTTTGEASCSETYLSGAPVGVRALFSGSAPFAASASGLYAEVINLPAPGYWLATANGQVYGYGAAQSMGGVPTSTTTGPVVGIAATPSARGYWVVTADGTVAAFGDAKFYGDLPDLNKHVTDVVAIAPTSNGAGYYLVGADGGFFTFGDAKFHGSLPGIRLRVKDVVGVVATPGGAGYLLVGSDGGVFAFGTTRFYGSLPGLGKRVHDIRAILPSSTGLGYILVGADGGAFNFGTGARFHGSLPGEGVKVSDVAGLALTTDDGGYYMAGADGHVYGFGDAQAWAELAGYRPPDDGPRRRHARP